jgi:hypothetical protein
VTSENENRIAALRDVITDLEKTPSPDRDEKAFDDLKRILLHRIENLENGASLAPASHT